MPNSTPNFWSERDGTGQRERLNPALLPEHFLLDGRSMGDWVRFARELGGRLRYFDFDNSENGDWSNFLGTDERASVAEILRFMEDPNAFSDQPDKAAWLARPHFVLFLVFLQLLKQEQDAINGFTKRHLDYYYRDVLGLKPKTAEADHAFMLMELVRGVAYHRVEKGTLLQSGKTPNGQPRLFQTTDEIVVNQTKVSAVKVFFQEREYISFEKLLQNPENLKNGHILKVAIGDPADGYNWLRMELAGGIPADNFIKSSIAGLLRFSQNELKLSLGELRRYISLNGRIEGAWHRTYYGRINAQLLKINNFSITNYWDFNTNFRLATGHEAYPPLTGNPPLPAASHPFRVFEGDIRHVQDLYERIIDLGYADKNTTLSDELKTIEQSLESLHPNFLSIRDFMDMMTDFQTVQQDWKKINAWLIKIDKGKVYLNRQTRPYDALWRLKNVSGAVFRFTDIGISDITDAAIYWEKILEIERYFQLPAEDVLFLLEKWAKPPNPPDVLAPDESRRMVSLLRQAHQKNALQREAIQLKNTYRFLETPGSFGLMFKEIFGIEAQNKEKVLLSFKEEKENDKILGALSTALLANDSEAEEYIRDTFFMAPRDYKTIYGIYQNAQRTPANIDDLYQTVVAAQRRKNDQPLFSGKIIHKGLYSAPDASVLFNGREGEPFPRWRTFGWKSPQKKDKPGTWQNAAIGFVIQSPLLALSAGIRTITLSIKFHEWSSAVSPISALKESFEYLLSHEKTPEGIAATFKSVESDWNNTDKTAQLKLELNAEQLPVTAPHPDFFAGTLPVLKVCLKQADEKENAKVLNEKNTYAAISTWKIDTIKLSVSASGLIPEAAWNDDSEINPKKPFLPFGLHPRVRSRFSFLHPEISDKKLASVDLNLVWMNRPEDFTTYYSGYGYNSSKPIQFQAKLNGNTAYNLFPTTGSAPEHTIPANANLGNPPTGWFLELQAPDFQHDKYTELLSGDVSYETSGPTGAPPKTTVKILARPNPPYTPRLKSFTFGYTSAEETLTEGFCHLLPFGHALPEKGVGNSFPLLPPLLYEAELYLGLEMAVPPQTLSLLFQMADGTADPDAEARPLRWQYLAADGWRPRKGDKQEPAFVLADETGGLSRSGIVHLLLPETASSHNPALPSGMIWLRIAIDHYRHSVCDTIGIHPQAVQVVRVASTDVADDPGKPLPPHTIGNFVARRSDLKTPKQPYSSFGGRSPESDIDFYVRISERLRHKQRALSIWDIEHLVLQAFPDVYRAKCLPSGWLDDAMPGTVEVILVPNLRGRLPMDPFKPQFPANRLAEVAAWLRQHGPIPAQYRVRNARFVPLRVEAVVQFHPGLDPGYYKQQLSEALTEHLAPWAFDQGADIRFGGSIYPGQLLWFIESQPYVDFVMDLKLYRNNTPEPSGQVLTTADPDEVWVSDTHHDIRLYSDRVVPAQPTLRGVGYWAVQIDFKIA